MFNPFKKIWHFFAPFQTPGPSRWWPVPLFVAANAFGWWAAFNLSSKIKPYMNLLHITVFCVWTLAFSPFAHHTLRWSKNLIRIFLVGVLAALTAEGLQFWLPPHVPLWSDVGFSSSGVLLACVILRLSRLIPPSKQ